jgi:RHS repeat-associated protein
VAGVATTNPIGHVVFVDSYFNGTTIFQQSGTIYWNYDPMGRVKGTKVCTPINCNNSNINLSAWYDLSNTYDLAGNMASYTDGFGTTISSTYDGANRLLKVTSSKNDLTHPGTLWTANSYSPVGLAQATLGNGVVDTRQYTNRTWLQSVNAKTTTGPVIYSEALTYYTNGNPHTVTDPVNGNWTYTYDPMNRISTGISTNTGQGCQFTYDPFGNRKTSAPDQGTCTSPSFSFTASTTNHIDGYCYDGAGNLNDAGSCPPSGSNHQYFYDGYNHLLSPNFNQAGRAGYTVDAFGHRVGKSLNGTWARIYLYGLDGNPVAEMDGTGAWQQTNVHVGGQFLAEYQGTDTDFQHSDHLATIRAQSNSAGTRITTCSNLPFGDSLNCNGNTNPSGYHFTGKERDTESGLDNFGARYYASNMGRFISSDALLNSGRLENPQTWNRYSYGLNNPLRNTDPTGLYTCGGSNAQCSAFAAALRAAQSARDSFKKGSAGYSALNSAINAYGKAGIDNGVHVGFGSTSGAGNTRVDINVDANGNKVTTSDNPTGQNITVTIDPSKNGNTTQESITAAHEGSHVADGTALVGALPIHGLTDTAASAGVLAGPLNLTQYQTEMKAYTTSSYTAQGMGLGSLTVGNGNVIWNSSWAAVDVQTMRSTGIQHELADPKGLYNVTPDNQGPKQLQ